MERSDKERTIKKTNQRQVSTMGQFNEWPSEGIDASIYVWAMDAFHRYRKSPADRIGPWALDIIDRWKRYSSDPEIGPDRASADALKELEDGPSRRPRVSFDDDYRLRRRYAWLMRELPPIWDTWRHSGARDAVLREVLGRYRGTSWDGSLPNGKTPSTFALDCLGTTEETLRRARRRLETRWSDERLAKVLDFSHMVERQPNGMLRRREGPLSS
jgi:hypothetical protein